MICFKAHDEHTKISVNRSRCLIELHLPSSINGDVTVMKLISDTPTFIMGNLI